MASSISNAPLSKKEQEEEEMRNELTAVGLYDENMSVKEMKQLIGVLNESKNDSRINEDIIDDSKQNTSTNTEYNTTPLPTFSYRQAASSGSVALQKSPIEESRNSNNKNLQASSSNLSDTNFTENIDDSEPIYDKNSNFKTDEDYPPLHRYKTRSTTADTRTRSQETKKLAAPKRSSLERWTLDPLKFIKENATPLRLPENSISDVEESLPYCSEEVDFNSKEFDELCQAMFEKLTSFNNDCMQAIGAKETAPIKINYEDIPASAATVTEKSFPTNTEGSNGSTRNTYERVTKRKALNTIAADTANENDENGNDEFVNTKKRKFQQGKKEEAGVKRNQESLKNSNTDKPIETISIDDNKDSSDNEFDNSNFKSIRRNPSMKVATNLVFDEQQSQYPRRIEPPNPAKKNYKGPRAKKKNPADTLIQSEPEKKPENLNDEEIVKVLKEIEDHIDDSDCVDITGDIKPPPTPKHITKRLQQAANHLESARESKEQKLKAEEKAKEQKEKEERLKKDERISSRLQEQENEEGRRLENERKLNEQNDFYRNFINNKSKVTRSSFQRRKTEEELAEDLLLDGDDDEPTITKVVQKQNCPICQKSFSAEDIENHASGCDAYAADPSEEYNRPSTSRRSIERYKCQMCDNFETLDGNLLDEHVSNCKVRQESSMNGVWGNRFT